jgi:hypothetical protein
MNMSLRLTPCDDRIKYQRQRRHQQDAWKAGSSDQPECAPGAETGRDQDRHHEPSEGEHGNPGGAGETGEERAGEDSGDRSAAAQASEQRVEHRDQALRRAALGEQVAGQREQRDRWQRRVDHQAVVADRDSLDRDALRKEQQQGGSADDHEDRRTQDGSDGEHAE